MERRLIVGLGNPGAAFKKTRHNLGFMVVEAFASKHQASFKKESRFQGMLASFELEKGVERRKALLLLPTTFMNLSGVAARATLDYYGIPFEGGSAFLVVVDDVHLEFGVMRLRDGGSTGGHNGLKSIEEHVQGIGYARLRLGIGPLPETISLHDYVLSPFSAQEEGALPPFIDRGVQVLECWLNEGVSAASQRAAAR